MQRLLYSFRGMHLPHLHHVDSLKVRLPPSWPPGSLQINPHGPNLHHRGARWLLDCQRPDGAWDEESFTGCGFPGYGIGEERGARIFEGRELCAGFMIRYHLYRNCFPLLALGRYRAAVRASERSIPSERGPACDRRSCPPAAIRSEKKHPNAEH